MRSHHRPRYRRIGAWLIVGTLLSMFGFLGLSVVPDAPMASAAAGDMTLTVVTTSPSTDVAMPINGVVTGTVTIDWGDSSSDNVTTAGDVLHTYANPGSYTITISGLFTWFGNCNGYTGAEWIVTVLDWGNNGTDGFDCAFSGATSLLSVPGNLPSAPQTRISSTRSMFESASSFNQDLNLWDTSTVHDMSYMFSGASLFNQSLWMWDTSNVYNMKGMFSYANVFNGYIESWDVSQVIDMDFMFQGATSFNGSLDNWNVGSVTTMSGMFMDATTFDRGLSSWDTSNVASMGLMFKGATSFNQNISSWDTSSVTYLGQMFEGATSFNQNLANWNVGSVTTMAAMLNNCGLTTTNYSNTLIGWGAGSTLSGVPLGATGRIYDATAIAARTVLTVARNWTITGDSQAPLPPTPPTTLAPTPTSSPTSTGTDPSGDSLVPIFAG